MKTKHLPIRDIVLFAMLGSLMFCSKIVMSFLPNIHLVGMLLMIYTIVLRYKALIPLYIFILLEGVEMGFSVWWMPYLYVWIILFFATLILPKNISKKHAMIIYPIVCSLHGFLFGTLYAPLFSFLMKFNFEQMLIWIANGLSFDVIHGIANFVLGFFVFPLSVLFDKLYNKGQSKKA